MKKVYGTVGIFLFALCAQATPYVTNVVAKQRYPWNGMVDITYETYGFDGVNADDVFARVTAKDLNVGYTYVATNLIGVIRYTDGCHHVVWDMAQYGQLPNKRMEFSVSIKPCPKYCVIDVSEGASASSYPVSYLNAVPPGGWTDVYKTEKIVLRRVDPNHRLYSHTAYDYEQLQKCIAEGKNYWDVWLTDPYYIGVFEITQRQYELVMGESPEGGGGSGDTKPQEAVTYIAVRGAPSSYWFNGAVAEDSFMGRLRGKTGIHFDLPTIWQWERACTAGVETDFNNGGLKEDDLKLLGCYSGNSSVWDVSCRGYRKKLKEVGSYAPNNLGLYDMHGNVREWVLNADSGPWDEFDLFPDSLFPDFKLPWYPYGMVVFDPVGRYAYETSNELTGRYVRGGSYLDDWFECGSRWKRMKEISTPADGNGFRLCWTVK